jgi:hypothetical protein
VYSSGLMVSAFDEKENQIKCLGCCLTNKVSMYVIIWPFGTRYQNVRLNKQLFWGYCSESKPTRSLAARMRLNRRVPLKMLPIK